MGRPMAHRQRLPVSRIDVAIPLGIAGAGMVAVVRCGAEGGACRSRMGLVWALPRQADCPGAAVPKWPDFVLINDTGISPDQESEGGRRAQSSRREQLIRARWTRQEVLVRGTDLVRDDFDGWTDIFLCFQATRPRPNRLLNMGHNAYVHQRDGMRVETLGGHGLRFGDELKAVYEQYQATGRVQSMLWTRVATTVFQPPRAVN